MDIAVYTWAERENRIVENVGYKNELLLPYNP